MDIYKCINIDIYLVNVISETNRGHYIWYPRFLNSFFLPIKANSGFTLHRYFIHLISDRSKSVKTISHIICKIISRFKYNCNAINDC